MNNLHTPMGDFTTDPPGDLLGRASFAVFNHDGSHRFLHRIPRDQQPVDFDWSVYADQS